MSRRTQKIVEVLLFPGIPLVVLAVVLLVWSLEGRL